MTAPPPHDKPAEEALIGALLVKPRQVMESLGAQGPSAI
jgi:hypothetical protein